jgi:hypothetical protein
MGTSLFALATFTRLTASKIPKYSAQIGLIVIFFFAMSLMLSDDKQITATAERNIIVGLAMLFAMLNARFSGSQLIGLLRIFVFAGVLVSLIGIYQAFVGLQSSPTIYSLGLAESNNDLSSFALTWKLYNIQRSGLVSFQKALSIGLYSYSNNFAEYLVYVLIALSALKRLEKIRTVTFLLILSVISAAMFFTQSRTCQVAFLIILFIHTMWSTRDIHMGLKLLINGAIIVAALVALPGFVREFLGYDNFETLEGRFNLDIAAVNDIFHGVSSILFGGHVHNYYLRNLQDPHNIILFLSLQFGLLFTAFVLTLMALLLIRLSVAPVAEDGEHRIFRQMGMLGVAWMLFYGLTWSVLSVGLADMTWAFVVGAALSYTTQPKSPHLR